MLFRNLRLRLKNLLKPYEISPDTKVELWLVEFIDSNQVGRMGSRTLTKTITWSEFKGKDDFLPDKNYGPQDTIVGCLFRIDDDVEELIACPKVTFEDVMSDVPIRTINGRDVWINTQIRYLLHNISESKIYKRYNSKKNRLKNKNL